MSTTTSFAFKQTNKDINVVYNQFLCLQADKQRCQCCLQPLHLTSSRLKKYQCHLQPLHLPSSRQTKISMSSTTTSFAFKQTNKDINVVYNHFLYLQADKQRCQCCLQPLPFPSSRRTKISMSSTITSFDFTQTNKHINVVYNHFLCLQADKQRYQCHLQPLTFLQADKQRHQCCLQPLHLPSSRQTNISMSSTTTSFAFKQTNKDINVVYNHFLCLQADKQRYQCHLQPLPLPSSKQTKISMSSTTTSFAFKQTNKYINVIYNHFLCLQANKQRYQCCLQPLPLPSSRQTKISMLSTTTYFAFKQTNKDINVIYNHFLYLQADKQRCQCCLQPLPFPSSRRTKISMSSTINSFAFKQTNKHINVVYNHFLCLQADKQRYQCCLQPLPLPSSRQTKISMLSTTTSFALKQTNKDINVVYNHFLCPQADKQRYQCCLQPLPLPSGRQTKISMSSTTTSFTFKQTNKNINVVYNHLLCPQADEQRYQCHLQPLPLPSSRQTKISMSSTKRHQCTVVYR